MARRTTFRRRTRDGVDLVEATLSLVAARVAIAVVPFRLLSRSFAWRHGKGEVPSPDREIVRRTVRHAIRRACRFLPGTYACFPRAVAAQAMLRRRGMTTTLYYGAATLPERGLTAHVWLQDGPVGGLGHGARADFHALARFPDSAP